MFILTQNSYGSDFSFLVAALNPVFHAILQLQSILSLECSSARPLLASLEKAAVDWERLVFLTNLLLKVQHCYPTEISVVCNWMALVNSIKVKFSVLGTGDQLPKHPFANDAKGNIFNFFAPFHPATPYSLVQKQPFITAHFVHHCTLKQALQHEMRLILCQYLLGVCSPFCLRVKYIACFVGYPTHLPLDHMPQFLLYDWH